MIELLELDTLNDIIKNRITFFAAILELPESRLLDWSFVQAVFEWVCGLEDSAEVSLFKPLTEIFYHAINEKKA